MGLSISLTKIWVCNRKHIDVSAKRFFAISTENQFQIVVENAEKDVEEVEVPNSQDNKELGTHILYRTAKVGVEYDDANDIKEGDKITLMKWGNCIVNKVEDKTIYVKVDLADQNFAKTKKLHWVPMIKDFVIK